jgi:hypothetical protein
VPRITDKVALAGPEEPVATMKKAYAELPGRTMGLPEGIKITYLVVENDELLRLSDSEKFRAAIGGRGKIATDGGINKPYLEQGLIAHDMPDYPTENFLALLSS